MFPVILTECVPVSCHLTECVPMFPIILTKQHSVTECIAMLAIVNNLELI